MSQADRTRNVPAATTRRQARDTRVLWHKHTSGRFARNQYRAIARLVHAGLLDAGREQLTVSDQGQAYLAAQAPHQEGL